MTTYSSYAQLPRPDLSDPPNAPSAFTSLTDTLDRVVIPKFSSASARTLAIPSPTSGQHAWLTDSNTLTVYNATVGDWVTFAASRNGSGRAVAYTGHAEMTGGVFAVPATLTDVPNCSLTFTTYESNALAVVNFSGDFSTTAGSAGTGILLATVDGVEQTAQANFCGANTTAGARATCAQTLLVTIGTAGSHTIKLRAYYTGTAGLRLNGPHTSITATVFE